MIRYWLLTVIIISINPVLVLAKNSFELLPQVDLRDPLWFRDYIDGVPVEFNQGVSPRLLNVNVVNKIHQYNTKKELLSGIDKILKKPTKSISQTLSPFNYISRNNHLGNLKPVTDPLMLFDRIFFISGDGKLTAGIKNGLPTVLKENNFIILSPFWGSEYESKQRFGLAFRCSPDNKIVFGWARTGKNYYEPFLWDLENKRVLSIRDNLKQWLASQVCLEYDWQNEYLRWFNTLLGKDPLKNIMRNSYFQFLQKEDKLELVITFPHFAAVVDLNNNTATHFIPADRLADRTILGDFGALDHFYKTRQTLLQYIFSNDKNLHIIKSFDYSRVEISYQHGHYGSNYAKATLQDDPISRNIIHPKGGIYLNLGQQVFFHTEYDFNLKEYDTYISQKESLETAFNLFKITSIDYITQDGCTIYGTCTQKKYPNNRKKAFKVELESEIYSDLEEEDNHLSVVDLTRSLIFFRSTNFFRYLLRN